MVVGGLPIWAIPAAVEEAAEALAAPSLPRHVCVPDFRGLAMTEVWAVALKASVKVKLTRLPDDFPVLVDHEPPTDGRVVRQGIAPGTKVHREAEVELFVQFPVPEGHQR